MECCSISAVWQLDTRGLAMGGEIIWHSPTLDTLLKQALEDLTKSHHHHVDALGVIKGGTLLRFRPGLGREKQEVPVCIL